MDLYTIPYAYGAFGPRGGLRPPPTPLPPPGYGPVDCCVFSYMYISALKSGPLPVWGGGVVRPPPPPPAPTLAMGLSHHVRASNSGSDLRRAIALARHRAPKCCTRRVIFSAPWSTHKQTPESGCKDTYNTSVIHVDRHHTGSSPLSKICTRYTCFCYPFSRPICRQVALSSYSICNADCHWSSPLSLASS